MSGIYQIRNLVNNKIYIGSAKDFYHREACHLSRLKSGKHHSPYLQNSFNKYGKNNFKFEILAECPSDYLIKLEQWFIDKLKPEYNICQVAGRVTGVLYKDNLERCLKAGLPKRKLSEHQVKEVIELKSKGKTTKEIALIYNVNGSVISRILNGKVYKNLGIQDKPINTNIKANKLEDKSLVLTILKEVESGVSQYKIANKYNIDQSSVSRIKTKSKNFSWLKEHE